MNQKSQTWTSRAYWLLLRVLPFDFRAAFGRDMERTFHDQASEAELRQGKTGLLRLWFDTVVGIFRIAPDEHWQILQQDTRYALRMMRQNPGYTAVVVITLALGVGVNTAIFSVVHGTLLRPLPYAQGDQLVIVRQQALKAGIGDVAFSVAEINDYRRQNHTLSELAEYHHMTFTLFGHGQAERVATGVVSPNFFDMLGVRPILGRTFLPADEQPGAPPVLVLSYEYWRRSQRGDPTIIGKTFEMNDKVHTVVGVLPPVPQFPHENDVYMPTSACPFRSAPALIANRDTRMMGVFARLKPGATLEQSRADLETIAGRLQQEYPKSYPADAGFSAISVSLRQELTRQARPTLYVLLGAAGFVLLIACANVANFTLARMSQRERELMMRSALGAGRGRLLRQLLTESALAGIIAGALGLVLAWSGLSLLVQFATRLTPRAREINLNGWVLLFALLTATVASLVSGSALAFSSSRASAIRLQEGSTHSTPGIGRRRLRNALIVLQVAFSLVLLAGAGLMVRSLVKLQEVDAGFVAQRVLTMGIDLNWAKYKTPEHLRQVGRNILEKVQALPGVLSVAVSSSFPLDPDSIAMGPMRQNFRIEGQPVRESQTPFLSNARAATPDYFKILGIPLVAGRTFTSADKHGAPLVVVLNQSVARHHWPGTNPIGRRISFDEGKTWATVIGIVGDTKEFSLNEQPSDEIYLPLDQNAAVGSLLVRTVADPMSLANQILRSIREVDPETAIPNLETLEQARSDTLASPRLRANLLGLFAVLALVIAATGIGGILALSVNQRVHEIGIRLAVGARPVDILLMVIRQGMTMVLAGLALGLAGALAITPLLHALLFQVTPTDPLTFVGVASLLGLTALLACYLPARRSTRIDPLVALRHE